MSWRTYTQSVRGHTARPTARSCHTPTPPHVLQRYPHLPVAAASHQQCRASTRKSTVGIPTSCARAPAVAHAPKAHTAAPNHENHRAPSSTSDTATAEQRTIMRSSTDSTCSMYWSMSYMSSLRCRSMVACCRSNWRSISSHRSSSARCRAAVRSSCLSNLRSASREACLAACRSPASRAVSLFASSEPRADRLGRLLSFCSSSCCPQR
mmetsp:Transcript_13854/g.36354  ORF Transcript_13854/g.36354 Transcript_13854/m.36354 type:complete len:209 (+) Transcript_13854:155-781(+)